jgi:hypothetical protein
MDGNDAIISAAKELAINYIGPPSAKDEIEQVAKRENSSRSRKNTLLFLIRKSEKGQR